MSPIVVGLTMTSLQDAPPLGLQREAAFALVAQGPQQRVTGFRVDVEFAAGGLLHRDVDARAGPFVTGIGEDGQVLEVGTGLGQDRSRAAVRSWALPGGTSETHSGTPPGAVRACTFPAGSWALPEYHLSISFPFLLVFLSAHRSEEIRVPSRIR